MGCCVLCLPLFIRHIDTLSSALCRAGFLIPYTLMPVGYKWLNRASPTTWILYGLGGSQLGDSQTPLVYNPAAPLTTVGQFMKTYFDYDYSFIWW